MNPIFACFWYLFGFTTALFLITEIQGPWAIITFFAALIFRAIFQRLIFEPVFGRQVSAAQHWMARYPISAQFWFHAKQWAKRMHSTRDPRMCAECILNHGRAL